MPIRILMKINEFSAFLQTMSGEILVDDLNHGLRTSGPTTVPLIRCTFSKKVGQTGFKNKNGFNSAIFEAIKPTLDVMIHSYFAGMILDNQNYAWIEDSLDKTIEVWCKEKGINYEASD
jgi:hypothetical protein